MRALPWLLVATLPTTSLAAQATDHGVFSIRKGGREIGREEFTMRPGRGPDGKAPGSTIATVVRYPSIAPTITAEAVLERTPEGRFTVFQLEYRAPDTTERYLAGQDRGRITLHRFAGESRSARELPGGAHAYVMVDGVYSLYRVLTDLAGPAEVSATVYLARTERRVRVTVGAVQQSAGRRRVVLGGQLSATVTLDETGRIQRIDLPHESLTVVLLED